MSGWFWVNPTFAIGRGYENPHSSGQKRGPLERGTRPSARLNLHWSLLVDACLGPPSGVAGWGYEPRVYFVSGLDWPLSSVCTK